MARIRDDTGLNARQRFLRWLLEGDDALDQALADGLDAPPPRPLPSPRAVPVPAAPDPGQRRRERASRWLYVCIALLLCVGIMGILLRTAADLPAFGRADNPTNNEVPARYIEKGLQETGAVNIVAGMILDYRAFDTLGESNVLFVAACTVVILLRLQQGDGHRLPRSVAEELTWEPRHDVILQTMASLLVPLALMFGLYVVLNGHLSPGGGFSGGTVMGAALILYLAAFGFEKAERFFTFRTFRAVSVCALGFYALAKAYSFFTGANGLPSVFTPGTPGALFSAGLIPYLNIAVGLVVACTMYAFFTLFRKGDV